MAIRPGRRQALASAAIAPILGTGRFSATPGFVTPAPTHMYERGISEKAEASFAGLIEYRCYAPMRTAVVIGRIRSSWLCTRGLTG